MPKQEQYQSQNIQENVSLPPQLQAMGAPESYTDGFFQKVLEKGLGTVVKSIADADNKRQHYLAEEQFFRARENMLRWQDEYNKTHKGSNALTALQDYENAWRSIASNIEKEYGSQFSGEGAYKFKRELERGRLYAVADAMQYQNKEQALWYKSLDEAGLSNLIQEASRNPHDAAKISSEQVRYLKGLQERHPGLDLSATIQQVKDKVFEARIGSLVSSRNIDDLRQAKSLTEGLIGGGVPSGVGRVSAQYETGDQGILGMGYDPNGGTSYGKWQLSSKKGSYQEWLDILASKGEKGAAVADELKKVGGYNTGSKTGAQVDAYLRLARENPELFEKTQEEYLVEKKYKPLLGMLPSELSEKINRSQALREMAISLANQHGEAGGAKILNRVYKNGMSNEDLINGVYDIRGNYFGSSPENIKASVKNRFKKERADILELNKDESSSWLIKPTTTQSQTQGAGTAPVHGISPKTLLSAQSTINSHIRQIAVESGLTEHDFKNQLAWAQQSGDFSFAEKSLAQIKELGMKEYDHFAHTLDISKTAYALTSSLQDIPFAQREATYKNEMNKIRSPSNAAMIDSVEKHALTAIQKQREDFIKDPAQISFALPAVQSRQTMQDKISASLQMQEKLGEGLIYSPRVLPKKMAEKLNEQYYSLKTGKERFAYLLNTEHNYGSYFPQVLQEMKISAGVPFIFPVLKMGSISMNDAETLLTGLTARTKDDVKVDIDFDKDNMKTVVGQGFDLYTMAKAVSEKFPNSDYFKNVKNDLLKAGYYYMKATGKDSLDSVNDALSLAYEDKTVMVLPKNNIWGMSANSLESIVNLYRAGDLFRKELFDQGAISAIDPKQSKGNRTKVLRENNIVENAVFMLSSDQKTFTLYSPQTEGVVFGKNGKPVEIPVEKILKETDKIRKELDDHMTFSLGG